MGGAWAGGLKTAAVAERRYDVARCSSRGWKQAGYRVSRKCWTSTLKEQDKEQQKLMLYSSLFSRTLWSMTYSNVSQGQCFECMRVCPVGSRHRTKK